MMSVSTTARVVVLLGLVAAASAVRDSILVRPTELATSKAVIDSVNGNANSTWVAGENEYFKGMTLEEAKKLMGAFMTPSYYMFPEEGEYPTKSHSDEVKANLPKTFDARTQWPDFVHPIRNQEQCGSCWAFAASEALSDRFAIASNGSVNVILSPEDLVSCDTGDMGCSGGILSQAWKYLSTEGIVTDKCFPYTAGQGQAAPCPPQGQCAAQGVDYKKYKSQDFYRLASVADIQKAIMTNGPVEAGFMVYKSFMSYKSGVYQREWWQFWDELMGGHAIKIIGWGTEDGVDFWMIANSWGTTWGLDGYFKIKRGVNECSIEDTVYAGHPDLS